MALELETNLQQIAVPRHPRKLKRLMAPLNYLHT